MTIRQATRKMLQTIHNYYSDKAFENGLPRTRDKDIAEALEISPVTYSRLLTQTQNPDIITWAKICKKFKEVATNEEFNNLINEIC